MSSTRLGSDDASLSIGYEGRGALFGRRSVTKAGFPSTTHVTGWRNNDVRIPAAATLGLPVGTRMAKAWSADHCEFRLPTAMCISSFFGSVDYTMTEDDFVMSGRPSGWKAGVRYSGTCLLPPTT